MSQNLRKSFENRRKSFFLPNNSVRFFSITSFVFLSIFKIPKIKNFQILAIPGGFSYGDYLRTGAIARFSPIVMGLIGGALVNFGEKNS